VADGADLLYCEACVHRAADYAHPQDLLLGPQVGLRFCFGLRITASFTAKKKKLVTFLVLGNVIFSFYKSLTKRNIGVRYIGENEMGKREV
jgi:hypothetical protein